jgi:hypothetical protein
MKLLAVIIGICVFSLFPQVDSSAQQLPLGRQINNELNKLILEADVPLFTAFRSADWLEYCAVFDTLHKSPSTALFDIQTPDSANRFSSRVPSHHWLRYRNNKFTLVADPYIDAIAGGSSKKDGILWQGKVGAIIQGNFDNKLTFRLGAYSSLTEFPLWIDQYIMSHRNRVPGGPESSRDNNGRYAYTYCDAALNYMPYKQVLLSVGYGKQFIGDGYRSLLLSDNAFNYPFARLKTSFWKLHYQVMYSYLNNDRRIEGSRQGKYSINHYLGATIGKRLQIGLFENIIWVARDTNFQRGFEFQYINPFTFLRPVEFSLGSPDNSFFGMHWKYSFKRGYVYGQFALDDINIAQTFKNKKHHLNNKYAIQLGIWTHQLFLKNLSWRIEWNNVRPYTYGHRKIDQNYTHNQQSLTHPFAANFNELLSIFDYTYHRFYAELHNALVIRGENPGLSYNNGENLWGGEQGVPALGSKTMQGDKHNYWYHRLSIGYLINPVNRLSIQADLIIRSHATAPQTSSETYWGLGIRTGLFNRMDDL